MNTQRTIKFRAWHKIDKEMINVFVIDQTMKGGTELNANFSRGYLEPTDHRNFYLHDVELMQFTGLTDSKGVEIYEHDLVLDKAGRRWKIEYSEKDMSFICRYLKNESDYVLYSNFSVIFHLPLKVIGNIYETKKQISTP